MNPRWVRQEDAYGCSVAVLAMITGLSYQQVRAEVRFDGRLASSCEGRQFEWLEAQGYQPVICYFAASGYDRRARFIPSDRPYLLWLSVGGATWMHSLLQLPDGTVLDPERPEPQALAGYPEPSIVRVVTRQE